MKFVLFDKPGKISIHLLLTFPLETSRFCLGNLKVASIKQLGGLLAPCDVQNTLNYMVWVDFCKIMRNDASWNALFLKGALCFSGTSGWGLVS